ERACSAIWSLEPSHPNETIAVFTHGGVIGVFCQSVLSLEPVHRAPFSVDNTAIFEVEVRNGTGTLWTTNDTCHLREERPSVGRIRPVIVIADRSRRPNTGGMDGTRHVVIVAFPRVQVLDVTGPLEVFSLANRAGGDERLHYSVEAVAAERGAIATSSGLEIVARRAYAAAT